MPKAPIVLNAQNADKPDAICIFLHGLGDTGDGWSWGFKDPSIRNSKVKYIFPTAKVIPVSLNGGYPMTAWFDIFGLSPDSKEDITGLHKGAQEIRDLIQDELKSYPHLTSKNVILGGFSLGGALALYTSVTHPEPLGGTVALSTWLPSRDEFIRDSSILGKFKGSILQGHGNSDPVVPYEFGSITGKLLKSSGINVDFKTYSGMGHSSCDDEMKDVKNYIAKLL